MKVIFGLVTILFLATSCFADYVRFSDKDGNVLSYVKIEDDGIVSKEKCAENNGLNEKDIKIDYIKDNYLDKEEKFKDKVKGFKGKRETSKEREDRIKAEKLEMEVLK